MKLTNEGFPNRRSLEGIAADLVLNCSSCNLPVVKLEKQEEGVVVSSPLRRFFIGVAGVKKVFEGLREGNLAQFDKLLMKEFDGLDFYCRECDKVYCEQHYSLRPVWDDGFYDYTVGKCPEGHERIVDD